MNILINQDRIKPVGVVHVLIDFSDAFIICITANFPLEVVEKLPESITAGVYYGWACVDEGPVFKMVMSIGWNPYYKNKVKSMVGHSDGRFSKISSYLFSSQKYFLSIQIFYLHVEIIALVKQKDLKKTFRPDVEHKRFCTIRYGKVFW